MSDPQQPMGSAPNMPYDQQVFGEMCQAVTLVVKNRNMDGTPNLCMLYANPADAPASKPMDTALIYFPKRILKP